MSELTLSQLRNFETGQEILIKEIQNIESDSLMFISDSQDVDSLIEYLGSTPDLSDYDSFFVEIGEGDYIQIWGMLGIVPTFEKTLVKIL